MMMTMTTTISIELPRAIAIQVTEEQFTAIAIANRDLRLERTAEGELIVNPPTGWETGKQNSHISGELYLWWRNSGNPGQAFDSSTGFTLPNGAIRSPDASWISQEHCNAISPQQKSAFSHICPDFVVELRSISDSLSSLQEKMQEYLENGAKLGWLLDPQHRRVELYRPRVDVEVLENPVELSGEDVLPGFMLKLARVWN